MTHRIGKWFTSIGFTMRRAYSKISTAKPSIFIFAAIVTAFALFLLAGGIYDILERPMFAFFFQSSVLYYYPYTLQGQSLGESIEMMIVYALGATGILLMYHSTKYAYKPRQAYMLLLTGIVLMLISYFLVENLVYAKLFPPSTTTSTSSGS